MEIGSGHFSTFLLHHLAHIMKRQLYTYENSERWFNRTKSFESQYHHIVFCPDWDKADFDQKHWGVIFIDHSPNSHRIVEIEKLKDKCDYMVINNTSPEWERHFRYSKIWTLFKYRYHYDKIFPCVAVVSNIKPLFSIK